MVPRCFLWTAASSPCWPPPLGWAGASVAAAGRPSCEAGWQRRSEPDWKHVGSIPEIPRGLHMGPAQDGESSGEGRPLRVTQQADASSCLAAHCSGIWAGQPPWPVWSAAGALPGKLIVWARCLAWGSAAGSAPLEPTVLRSRPGHTTLFLCASVFQSVKWV